MSGVRITYTGVIRLGMYAANVKAKTVEAWITAGLITKHDDGYDPDEVLMWIQQRDPNALRIQAGIAVQDWPARVA